MDSVLAKILPDGFPEGGRVVDMEVVTAGEDDVARIAEHAEDKRCLAWILLHKLFDLKKFLRRYILFMETEMKGGGEKVGCGGKRDDALPDELEGLVFVTT